MRLRWIFLVGLGALVLVASYWLSPRNFAPVVVSQCKTVSINAKELRVKVTLANISQYQVKSVTLGLWVSDAKGQDVSPSFGAEASRPIAPGGSTASLVVVPLDQFDELGNASKINCDLRFVHYFHRPDWEAPNRGPSLMP